MNFYELKDIELINLKYLSVEELSFGGFVYNERSFVVDEGPLRIYNIYHSHANLVYHDHAIVGLNYHELLHENIVHTIKIWSALDVSMPLCEFLNKTIAD